MVTDGFGLTLSGSESGAIGYLIDGVPPGIQRNKIDTTTHSNADGWESSQPSVRKAVPDTTFTLLYDPTIATALYAAAAAEPATAVETWTITDSDGSTWVCDGYILELGVDAIPTDDGIKQTITMAWTGEPVYTAAA